MKGDAGFPNFFMLYGPNSQPVSGGSALPTWFEIWSAYIARLLIAMLEGMVYLLDAGSRVSNYYVHRGRLLANAPWDGDHYYAISAEPNPDEFDFS